MKPANNAPLYASLYHQLAEICRKHGYALAVHGSIASDLDLIAVPWIESPDDPTAIVDEIINTFAFDKVGELTPKLHGRMVQTLAFAGGGTVYLDFSFIAHAPDLLAQLAAANERVAELEALLIRWLDYVGGADQVEPSLYFDSEAMVRPNSEGQF